MRAQDVSLTNFSVSPLPSTHREFRLTAELFFENTKQSPLYWDVFPLNTERDSVLEDAEDRNY